MYIYFCGEKITYTDSFCCFGMGRWNRKCQKNSFCWEELFCCYLLWILGCFIDMNMVPFLWWFFSMKIWRIATCLSCYLHPGLRGPDPQYFNALRCARRLQKTLEWKLLLSFLLIQTNCYWHVQKLLFRWCIADISPKTNNAFNWFFDALQPNNIPMKWQ